VLGILAYLPSLPLEDGGMNLSGSKSQKVVGNWPCRANIALLIGEPPTRSAVFD